MNIPVQVNFARVVFNHAGRFVGELVTIDLTAHHPPGETFQVLVRFRKFRHLCQGARHALRELLLAIADQIQYPGGQT